MILRRAFYLMALCLFAACNEYTTAVCRIVGKSDFPKFEESHVLRMYDSKAHESFEGTTKYQKVAEGTYLSDSGSKYSTCVVGGRRIVEVYTEDTNTFSMQTVTDQPDGYELAFIGFDLKALELANIPNQLIPSTASKMWKSAKREAKLLGFGQLLALEDDEPLMRLIVDNEKLKDQADFVKLGKPMGIQYRFYKHVP